MPDEQSNVGESVDKITDLLIGKPPPDPGTGTPAAESPGAGDGTVETEPAGEDAGAPELTPTTLAERLGIKPADLFRDLKIPVDGGDAMTLEEFKDAGKDLRGVKQAQSDLAEQRVKFENDTMTQRQQLQAAIGKIPPNLLTDDLIREVQGEHDHHVETERRALLAVRPDLGDSGKWGTTRDLLIAHLKPYGFHAIEVDSIIDHRLAKYVIDNAEREARLVELKASVDLDDPKLAGSKPKPAAQRPKAPDKPTRRRGPKTLGDKAAEVATLLGAK
jgi:hypothetical protein